MRMTCAQPAVEEGIVPGGGVTLINAISALDGLKFDVADINTGVAIMRKALEMPMRKLASNAGEDGAVIIENVRRVQKSKKNPRIGYNVMTGEFVDTVEAGFPDPAKVTRGAVENAASIAAMILTTEALITDIPEDEQPMPGGAPDMGGMY